MAKRRIKEGKIDCDHVLDGVPIGELEEALLGHLRDYAQRYDIDVCWDKGQPFVRVEKEWSGECEILLCFNRYETKQEKDMRLAIARKDRKRKAERKKKQEQSEKEALVKYAKKHGVDLDLLGLAEEA